MGRKSKKSQKKVFDEYINDISKQFIVQFGMKTYSFSISRSSAMKNEYIFQRPILPAVLLGKQITSCRRGRRDFEPIPSPLKEQLI